MRLTRWTLNALREHLVGWTLAEIDNLFESASLERDETANPDVTGQRRFRVEQYYARLNVNSPTDVRSLLEVIEEVLESSPEETASGLVRALRRDGVDVEGKKVIAPDSAGDSTFETLADRSTRMDAAHLSLYLKRMRNAVNSDPALAIGTAKELIEAVCKTILHQRGKPVDDSPTMPRLIREAAAELNLMPDDIPNAAKGADIIRRLLSNLMTISDGINELRRDYGTGHGKDGRWRGVKPRHARLAVESAAALTTFLMETHLERQPWANPGVADGRYATLGFHDGASGAEINILTLPGGKFEVQGFALWVNRAVNPPGAHTGDFHQVIEADGQVFRIRDGRCEITIERRGTSLTVQDNLACGGVNVTFSGEYERVGHPAISGG